MKKKWGLPGLFLFLLMLFCVARAQSVQAASYRVVHTSWEDEDRKVGKVTFSYEYDYNKGNSLYATKNGKKTLVVRAKNLSSVIVTNGSQIYYSVTTPGSYSGGTYVKGKAVVYQIKVTGKSKKKLFSARVSECFELCGYYGGKLYYIKELDPGTFGSYTIKSGKTKSIDKSTTAAEQYKQYFYLTPYRGALAPSTLKVYNASSGKKATITKKLYQYERISSKLYYVEFKSSNYNGSSPFKIVVKRCSLAGGSKKTLIKSLTVTGVVKITKTSITYLDANGKQKTKKY